MEAHSTIKTYSSEPLNPWNYVNHVSYDPSSHAARERDVTRELSTLQACVEPVALVSVAPAVGVLNLPLGASASLPTIAPTARVTSHASLGAVSPPSQAESYERNECMTGWSLESLLFSGILAAGIVLVALYADRQRRIREQVEMNRAFEKWEMRRSEVWNRKGHT